MAKLSRRVTQGEAFAFLDDLRDHHRCSEAEIQNLEKQLSDSEELVGELEELVGELEDRISDLEDGLRKATSIDWED